MTSKKRRRKKGRQPKKKEKKKKRPKQKWKTNQSTKINLFGCDTIVNSPSKVCYRNVCIFCRIKSNPVGSTQHNHMFNHSLVNRLTFSTGYTKEGFSTTNRMSEKRKSYFIYC